jgi:hypothetical protein
MQPGYELFLAVLAGLLPCRANFATGFGRHVVIRALGVRLKSELRAAHKQGVKLASDPAVFCVLKFSDNHVPRRKQNSPRPLDLGVTRLAIAA